MVLYWAGNGLPLVLIGVCHSPAAADFVQTLCHYCLTTFISFSLLSSYTPHDFTVFSFLMGNAPGLTGWNDAGYDKTAGSR
jgi:hypothetical protein